MRRDSLDHEFVEEIPTLLVEGILYVCIPFRTAVHLCPCGCRNKVVTPIKPARWHLTFDGDTVSLSPSIGNWQIPCRSHYWIRNDRIRWSRGWSDAEIEEGRERDARQLRDYYAKGATPLPQDALVPRVGVGEELGRVLRWLRGSKSAGN